MVIEAPESMINAGAEKELFALEMIATGSLRVFTLLAILTLGTYISFG